MGSKVEEFKEKMRSHMDRQVESLKSVVLGDRKSYRAKAGEKSMTSLSYTGKGGMQMERTKIPALTSTQVLVRVQYAGLNAYDFKRMEPLGGFLTKKAEPVGIEFCGIVEKLGWVGGDKVHMFPIAIGDVVFGITSGALSEFVCAEADKVYFKPDNMNGSQAAAFPVAGLKAYQALQRNNFKEGQTLLVLGAEHDSMFAKQAKLMKAAKVIGAVEDLERDGEFAMQYCDQVVSIDSFQEKVPEADLVVDFLSDPKKVPEPSQQTPEEGKENEKPPLPLYDQTKPLLKATAKYAQLNYNEVDLIRRLVSDKVKLNIQKKGFEIVDFKPSSLELKKLSEWFEQGLLKQPIDSTVSFEEQSILEAFEKIRTSQARGKIIVKM